MAALKIAKQAIVDKEALSPSSELHQTAMSFLQRLTVEQIDSAIEGYQRNREEMAVTSVDFPVSAVEQIDSALKSNQTDSEEMSCLNSGSDCSEDSFHQSSDTDGKPAECEFEQGASAVIPFSTIQEERALKAVSRSHLSLFCRQHNSPVSEPQLLSRDLFDQPQIFLPHERKDASPANLETIPLRRTNSIVGFYDDPPAGQDEVRRQSDSEFSEQSEHTISEEERSDDDSYYDEFEDVTAKVRCFSCKIFFCKQDMMNVPVGWLDTCKPCYTWQSRALSLRATCPFFCHWLEEGSLSHLAITNKDTKIIVAGHRRNKLGNPQRPSVHENLQKITFKKLVPSPIS